MKFQLLPLDWDRTQRGAIVVILSYTKESEEAPSNVVVMNVDELSKRTIPANEIALFHMRKNEFLT